MRQQAQIDTLRKDGVPLFNDGVPLFAGNHFPDKAIEQEAAAARDRVYSEIDRLDLYRAVAELEMKGYTVIPPHQAAPAGFADRLCKAVLVESEKDMGVPPDVKTGDTHKNLLGGHGQVQVVNPLLHRDPIFEEALMNERALALITYLLGENCILNAHLSQVKGPGFQYLPLHTDQAATSTTSPFPAIAQVANAVWVLTDYSADEGATCFVAGSHKLCRNPTFQEATDLSLFKPLEVSAGSILVWHGNTWHGAVPRSVPGLRVGIIQYFSRWYHFPVDPFPTLVSKEAIARNSPRFARLIGAALALDADLSRAPRISKYSYWG